MADEIMTTGTELSVIVPQIWSQNYYDSLLATLPFNAVVSKDYEGEIQNMGDTVKISTFPEFDEAEVVDEDERATASALTVTQQSLVINNRVVKDFIVTNKALMQSLPTMNKLRDLAIYSIQKKMQSLIIAATIPSASSPDHAIAYDSGTTLALADMLEAKELKDAADVPMANRHFVVGAAQLNDIFNITGFTSSDFITASSPLQSGNLPPALLGYMPHFTSVVGNTSYWFHASYLTLASQKGISVQEYDLGVDGKRATRVNVDTLFGLKQLDNTRIVTLS
jgi:hypothetical protein